LGVYLLCVFLLPFIPHPADANQKEEITIYIKSNGVHTDIVVPIKTSVIDWSQYFFTKHTLAKDSTASFVGIGWGDKGFYLETPTWGDLKFSTAFKAAFGISSSALHATFYSRLAENENCKKIRMGLKQYKRLCSYIENSLQLEKKQSIHIPTNANYGNYDAFYEAKGRYSFFKTCNTWANSALKVSGQKTAFWTALDWGMLRYHE